MDIFKLLGKIVIEGVEGAKKDLEGVSGKAEASESKITGAFKKIGAAVITYFATDKIIDFGKACVEATATISAEQSAFEQIMGDYSNTATQKVSEIADATGMVDSRLTPYMTSMTAKFKGLGYDIDDATSYAQDGLMLAADAAAFWDKSLDESMSHLNSFVNGSYEGGEAIGLFANDTQMAAYAVKQGLIEDTKYWASLEEKIKQATRLEYAQNMMKQSGAVGQAAKESGQYANVMANLSEKWRQFKGQVGEPILEKFVLPAVTKLSDFMDGPLQSGIDFFSEKVVPTIEIIGDSAEEHIIPILSDVGEKFMPLIETSLETTGELVEKLFPVIENVYNFIEPALSFTMDIITDIVEILPVAVDFLLDIVDPLNLIHEETINLTDAQKELIDKNKELADSLDEISEKTEKEVRQIDNEYRHYDILLDQLDNVVDKNGKIKAGYEDRATAILTTLSEATGVEFEIIDGEIQKYDELKDSIEDVITQMRTKAKLQAYEAEYNEAVAKETDAKTQYETALKEYEVNSNVLNSYYDTIAKLESGSISYNDLQAISLSTFRWDNSDGSKDRAIAKAIEEYKLKIAEFEPIVDTLGNEYKIAGQNLSDITSIMENFELASAESSEETLLLLETHFKKAELMTEEQALAQVETIEQMYEDYKTEVEKGTPGYTKAHLDGIGNLRIQARTEYLKFKGDVNSLMNDIVNTVEGKNSAFGESGRNGANSYINNFAAAAAEQAYKITNAISNITNGLSSITADVKSNSSSDLVYHASKSYSIPHYATGGIVTREHIAKVGENGAEAIIPLERNTEWIDRVAQRMSGSSSNSEISAKLDEMISLLKNQKIYLNGKALVGGIAGDIDKKLGSMARQKRRAEV